MLSTVIAILTLAVLAGLLVLLVFPISDAAQRLGDVINNTKR